MAFVEALTQLVNRIEGCAAAIILGVDGIPIERWVLNPASSPDIDTVATEFTTLLRRAMHTAVDTELGDLQEMVLATSLAVFVIRPITPEYFILIALNPGGNVGRARFELRKAQLSLETEFAI